MNAWLIALVVVAAVIIALILLEVIGILVARQAHRRFKMMTAAERFKYQNEMRKKEL